MKIFIAIVSFIVLASAAAPYNLPNLPTRPEGFYR